MPDPAVLFEDNHCLAVAKDAGELVQSDQTGDETLLDRARDYIRKKHAKPGNVYLATVHRLDRPASGVVLFARTSKAAGRLAAAFRERTVEKRYRVVVEGQWSGDARDPESYQTAEDWLCKDPDNNRSHCVREGQSGARKATLRYRVLGDVSAPGADAAWLDVELDTGRHHQIRVQMAARGHPVAGDVKYGASKGFGRWIAVHASCTK